MERREYVFSLKSVTFAGNIGFKEKTYNNKYK